nr:unnamed protein product [Callosobruchus chinensis]
MHTLYAHRYLMNYKLRKKLCESLVVSVLNYCDIVYFPYLDNRTKNRLQIIQNNCIRFTYSLRKFDHVSDKYVLLKWLQLPKLVNYHFLIYVYKLLMASRPAYLREKITFSRVMRDQSIKIPRYFTTLFRRSFSYNAAVLYNSIDNVYKNMSLSLFRIHVKNSLL